MNQGSSTSGSSPILSPNTDAKADANITLAAQQNGSPARPVVTYAFVALSIAGFAAMALSQLSPTHPDTGTLLLRWGANVGPVTLGGQWWRLLSSVFLHLGLIHLAVNMWCLWDLGSFAERVYGHAAFAAIYLVSGVAGAIFSLMWRPFALEAGASGAIFGIAGALIASYCVGHLPFSQKSAKAALLSVIAFAAYNLFVGLFGSGTGVAAHLGGLVFGFLVGLMLARTSLRMTIGLASVLLVLACALLARTKAYVVSADRGRTALAAGHSDQAILALSESVQKNPKFADGYALLGQAYMQKQQFAAAEAAYGHALQLEPKASDVRYQLGMALIAQRRVDDAMAIFTELAKSDPKNPAGQIGIGTAAELAGHYQLAMEAFRRAAEIAPRNLEACNNLGLAALQANQPDEAVSAFSKCVQLQPNNPDALMHLAIAYKAKGMEKEAEETYRRAVQASQARTK